MSSPSFPMYSSNRLIRTTSPDASTHDTHCEALGNARSLDAGISPVHTVQIRVCGAGDVDGVGERATSRSPPTFSILIVFIIILVLLLNPLECNEQQSFDEFVVLPSLTVENRPKTTVR